MRLEIGVVDAFTEKPFSGNPAAVCLLEHDLSDEMRQNIAMEMNLSETAFVQRTEREGHFNLRWFTPTLEIDLCGHATLASSFWMLRKGWAKENVPIHFHTMSGELIVNASHDGLEMNFPLIPTVEDQHPFFQKELFGKKIVKAAQLNKNWIFELENEHSVCSLEPDFMLIAKHSEEGFIITAAGEKYDIVSRFFGPNVGVPEDPVTGFAHCALMDYWNQKTGKTQLKAYQASRRGGELELEKHDDRVLIKGKAVVVYQAEMELKND
ncbi:PhzF family phenazine biosynthesis protein [Algoriphagus sp. NF]|uniref:PhzF family phenazine biosynthesis protein n=1 Tax=Algoriphagus sp. NF TaxID=2992756 RepID=UPI00237C3207|nr:PhzF family phenazine biosynthesis protein [Algoriphagus sp. NF]MCR9081756.1 PhzF family phenazine biosynthesis protein [Cyclobacteriaceae bacterium]MDE0560873.1 PhzF family phenazine biosynthesis protein [Algoriphagus sp. NF]